MFQPTGILKFISSLLVTVFLVYSGNGICQKNYGLIDQAIVDIYTYDLSGAQLVKGSGVVLSNQGLLITNYHLFAQANKIKATLNKQTISVGAPVAIDVSRDIVLLQASGNVSAIPIGNSDNIQPNDEVTAIGRGLGFKNSYDVCKIVHRGSLDPLFGNFMLLDQNIPLGSIGGAVVNNQNELVGITSVVAEKTKLTCYVIPINEILSLPRLSSFSQSTLKSYFHCLEGKNHMIEQKYAETIESLKKAISLDVSNPISYNYLGILYLRNEEQDKALLNFQRALGVSPAYEPACVNIAAIMYERGDYEEAMTYLDKAGNSRTSCAYNYYYGLSEFGLNHFEKAQDHLQQFAACNPSSHEAFRSIGKIHYKNVEYKEAIASYQKALDLKEDDAEVLNSLGELYYATVEYDSARIYLKKALQKDNKIPSAYYSLGNLYYDQGQYEEAIINYKKAAFLNEDYVDAVNKIGMALFKSKKINEAIEKYKTAIDNNPEFSEAYYNMGMGYYNNKDYTSAHVYLTEAINLDPDFPASYFYLGNTLYQQKKYRESIPVYLQALQKDPRHSKACYNLGNAYLQLNNMDSAMTYFQESVKYDPYSVDGHNGIGQLHLKNNQHKLAIEHFQHALLGNPNNPRTYYYLGNAYHVAMDYKMARENYNKVLTLDGKLPEVYANLGKIFMAEGDVAAAIVKFNRAIAMELEDAEVYYYLGLAFGKQKMFEAAIFNSEQAVKLDPNYAKAYLVMASAYEAQNDLYKANIYKNKAYQIDPNLRSKGQ